jgi:hypothetical protein
MKNNKSVGAKILAALITAASIASAVADERDAKRCAEVMVPSQRLGCFDAIFPRPSGNPGQRYRELTLRDLLFGSNDMDGQEVEVSGYLMIIDGIIGSLSERKFSKDGIFVSYDDVMLDRQKRLLDECKNGCIATVRGKVKSFFNGTIDVDADEVKFTRANPD